MPSHPHRSQIALVVDLDDTLIRTDLLLEQSLAFLKCSPFGMAKLVYWTVQGAIRFKIELARATKFDPSVLPYRESVLNRLLEAKLGGRKLILASASPEVWVQQVARHLDLFDHVLATNSERNLKGDRKRQEIILILGDQKFEYWGDSESDLSVWLDQENCIHAVAVNPSSKVRSRLSQKHSSVEFVQDADKTGPSQIRIVLKAIRVHQWAKNLLIFAPLLLAHRYSDLDSIKSALLAFVSFSALASTVYVLNDLFDLTSDRKHSSKSSRPFAAGALSILTGASLIPSLIAISVISAVALPRSFLAVLLGYLTLNFLYSFRLKSELGIDVVLLGVMYSLRILAGGAATDISLSPWLLGFSIFFFLGLAILKRYTEMSKLVEPHTRSHGRGYGSGDAGVLLALGVGASLVSTLIFVLYLNSPAVVSLYSSPERLWLMTPFLIYWVIRIWILAVRGQVHDDPVVFTLKDRPTYYTGAGMFLIFIWALQ